MTKGIGKMNIQPAKLTKAWVNLQNVAFIKPIHSDKEFKQAVELMDKLIDIVGNDSSHPLSDLLEMVCIFTSYYESRNYKKPDATAIEILKYLMEEHGIKQKDLPEIGSQGVVSEILSGKRELNVRQIQALAKRFNIDARSFL